MVGVREEDRMSSENELREKGRSSGGGKAKCWRRKVEVERIENVGVGWDDCS
jgi:hypothetical protein